MDLDPLNTVDPVAPHTTSFSSNIYLLKHEEKTYTSGQLLNLANELTPSPEEILYFTVGSFISPNNFNIPYKATTVGRLYGYKLSCIENKLELIQADNQVAFGRIYVLDKTCEIIGKKIGVWNEIEV